MKIKFILLLTFCLQNIFAQGGSSVITLVTPPPGGEGASAMQAGGEFVDGAADMYYNPASQAVLNRSKGSTIYYTESHENLLPILNLANLNQSFHALALSIKDSIGGYDMGGGVFKNKVNFGSPETYSPSTSNSQLLDNSNESVYGLTLGIRLGCPISLGGAIKFYDSKLNPELNHNAIGWAFDLGLLINPTFRILKPIGISSIELTPSLGIVYSNLGADVTYTGDKYDPIPTQWNGSRGLDFNIGDVINIKIGDNSYYEAHRNTTPNQHPVYTWVTSYTVLIYSYSFGKLNDPDGNRFENFESKTFQFNFNEICRFVNRINSGDFSGAKEKHEHQSIFTPIHLFGLNFNFNPRISWGNTTITSPSGIRNGQKSSYFSFAL